MEMKKAEKAAYFLPACPAATQKKNVRLSCRTGRREDRSALTLSGPVDVTVWMPRSVTGLAVSVTGADNINSPV